MLTLISKDNLNRESTCQICLFQEAVNSFICTSTMVAVNILSFEMFADALSTSGCCRLMYTNMSVLEFDYNKHLKPQSLKYR